ncbi:MAG TPA: DUF2959 family protein, partial [Desulfosarcina sp.]|nr:DUF2959 family protein [Desulfosarcina sp.]
MLLEKTFNLAAAKAMVPCGPFRAAGLIVAFLVLTAGCQTTYYALWEKMGKEKRHLLRDSVADAREEQAEASEQFASVVERIKALYG